MSTWRRKAIALFPHLRKDIEQPGYSLGELFRELCHDVRVAHQQVPADAATDTLFRRAHGFAEWCMRQGGDLWREAAIGFYEDLFNGSGIPWSALVPWISPYAAEQIEQTWALGVDGKRAAEFRTLLRERTREAYRTHVAATGEVDAF